MNRVLATIRAWLDSSSVEVDRDDPDAYEVDWLRVLPIAAVHLACLGPILVGWSPVAVGVAVAGAGEGEDQRPGRRRRGPLSPG